MQSFCLAFFVKESLYKKRCNKYVSCQEPLVVMVLCQQLQPAAIVTFTRQEVSIIPLNRATSLWQTGCYSDEPGRGQLQEKFIRDIKRNKSRVNIGVAFHH